MEENIFELLEEWDYAGLDGDKEEERKVGRKIAALRAEWRKRRDEKNEIVDARKRQTKAEKGEE